MDMARLTDGLLFFLLMGCGAAQAAAPSLAVLDIELTGDLGGPELATEHQARIAKESEFMRAELAGTHRYSIADDRPAQALLTRLRSEYSYLHDCNGCDLQIGQALGAQQVLTPWVNRVSALILTLTYEIHDTSTGQILARESYDFRGDNDAAWTHAIRFMIRHLQVAAEVPASSTP
jgi:hypothetical protein